MRILILYPFLLHAKARHGSMVRIHKMVTYFSQRHAVYVACFYSEREKEFLQYVEPVRQMCKKMIVLPLRQRVGLARRMKGFLLSSTPNELMAYDSSEMRAEIARLVEEEPIDVAHVTYSYMLPYRSVLKCPAVVTADEPLFRHWGSQIPFVSLPNKLRLVAKVRKWREFELKMFRQFDRVFTMTEQEKQILSRLLPGTPVEVSPFGNGTESFSPMKHIPEEPNSLVFVGSYLNRSNVDAMNWFCESMLPRIRKEVPSTKLFMVGPDLPACFDKWLGKGVVEAPGYVESPAEWISRGAVFICPVRMGGGIRSKIPEAMAVGKPVVTTPLGLEGIDAIPGEEILIGATEEEFAEKVVLLLKRPDLRHSIGERGRKVAEKYRIDDVFSELEQCYQRLIDGSSKRDGKPVEQQSIARA